MVYILLPSLSSPLQKREHDTKDRPGVIDDRFKEYFFSLTLEYTYGS